MSPENKITVIFSNSRERIECEVVNRADPNETGKEGAYLINKICDPDIILRAPKGLKIPDGPWKIDRAKK